ncbi:MAG TPA: lysophospholipase [Candidatus Limnocylindrales bacterium]|nr:lysophospholipase [Candidatus Limnocylindrales bacterium]
MAPMSLASQFFLDTPDGHGRLHGLAWEIDQPRGRIYIIHGLGDHAARYRHVAEALALHGFAVEALDLPGHGESTGMRGHVRRWDEYRAAIEIWMKRSESLPGAETRVILGQSMGALIALDWALCHPRDLRALILAGVPFEVVLRPSMLKVKAAQLAAKIWPKFSQGNTILPSMLSRDPEVIRAHSMDPLVHYQITARLFFEFQRIRMELIRRAPELAVDTLIIHGGADPISSVVGAQRWAARAPKDRVTARFYPGLLHEVLNELEKKDVLRDVMEWLDRVLAPDVDRTRLASP